MQHRFDIRVYWEDTDAGGIVYHASYLRFMERARTEFLRELGLDQVALRRDHGLICVVYDMHIRFRQSAVFDDLLEVITAPARPGAAQISLTQEIRRKDTPICAADVICACVTEEGTPKRWPALWREGFMG